MAFLMMIHVSLRSNSIDVYKQFYEHKTSIDRLVKIFWNNIQFVYASHACL